MVSLKDQHELFCQEYIIDLNATQAAIRAGYSERTARLTGHRLITNDNVQARLSELKSVRNQKLNVSAQWVLQKAMESFEFNAQAIFDKDGNPQMVNAPAAGKFLEMCGKHIDVNAFARVPDDEDDRNKANELNITFEVRDSVAEVNTTNAKPE